MMRVVGVRGVGVRRVRVVRVMRVRGVSVRGVGVRVMRVRGVRVMRVRGVGVRGMGVWHVGVRRVSMRRPLQVVHCVPSITVVSGCTRRTVNEACVAGPGSGGGEVRATGHPGADGMAGMQALDVTHPHAT